MLNREELIKEFILYDNCDKNGFSDLITFDKEVLKIDIINAINKVKEDLPSEYTNEDIYEGIDSLGVPYTVKWLGNIWEIDY